MIKEKHSGGMYRSVENGNATPLCMPLGMQPSISLIGSIPTECWCWVCECVFLPSDTFLTECFALPHKVNDTEKSAGLNMSNPQ